MVWGRAGSWLVLRRGGQFEKVFRNQAMKKCRHLLRDLASRNLVPRRQRRDDVIERRSPRAEKYDGMARRIEEQRALRIKQNGFARHAVGLRTSTERELRAGGAGDGERRCQGELGDQW